MQVSFDSWQFPVPGREAVENILADAPSETAHAALDVLVAWAAAGAQSANTRMLMVILDTLSLVVVYW